MWQSVRLFCSGTTMTTTLGDLVRLHGAKRPDHPYLQFEDRTDTFGYLDEVTNRLAGGLTSAGVTVGDRVALLAKNNPACFELMFAAAKCNAVFVPINWRLTASEVATIVRDSQAKVLVVESEFVPCLSDISSQESHVGTIVVLGRSNEYPSYEEWVQEFEPIDTGLQAQPEDVCLQLYTSGTTGTPKGAQLTNESLLGHMASSATLWGYDSESVNLVVSPLFHVGGTGTALLSILNGATTVLLREVNVEEIKRVFSAHRVTNTLLVPAIIQLLIDDPDIKAVDWSTLRTLMYGASPISETLLRKAMNIMDCDFVQLYGITETSGCVSCLSPVDHDPVERPELLRSCGKPLPWVEVKIVDPDSLQTLPAHEAGEIWARSTQNMLGYWNQSEATDAAITADGWFRTGDAGYFDDEGFLYLHDRIKDMIVSGAENIYPAEVENALMGYPGIADVGVIGVPDERWGETPKAVVVLVEGSPATADDIIAYCRTQMAGFKCPTSVDFVAALPRNPSGKILKRELREPYWQGRERRVG
jgi:long-chain acyl-CoA synthetase